METSLVLIVLLSLPLVIGGIIHMIIVKKDILSYLKIPIHKSWFGENKTWRGLFIMPLATLPGVILARSLEVVLSPSTQVFQSESVWFMSILLGLGYCLPELPNSFIKRRLGIKEGQSSEHLKWLFILIDQGDSVFGCALVYKIMIKISWEMFWSMIIVGTVIHLVFNIALFRVKIRKNPF